MSEPVDNPLSDQESNKPLGESPGVGVPSEGNLPEIFRGRMFCVAHGRQCYRGGGFGGENLWICPDERHARPLT